MPAVAATVNEVLAEPFKAGGTAEGLGLEVPAGGKTGTTNQWSDAWFIGYTTTRSTAVWMGDPRGSAHTLHDVWALDQRHHSIGGGTVPAPIWREAMNDMSAADDGGAFPSASASLQTLRGAGTPRTTGMELEAAVATLHAAGYDVHVAPDTAPSSVLPAGSVLEESTSGSLVTLVLSEGSDAALLGTTAVVDQDGTVTMAPPETEEARDE